MMASRRWRVFKNDIKRVGIPGEIYDMYFEEYGLNYDRVCKYTLRFVDDKYLEAHPECFQGLVGTIKMVKYAMRKLCNERSI